jgi:hypothetical protein
MKTASKTAFMKSSPSCLESLQTTGKLAKQEALLSPSVHPCCILSFLKKQLSFYDSSNFQGTQN